MKPPELSKDQTRLLLAAAVGISTGFLIATALDGWMAARVRKAAGCADCNQRRTPGWQPAPGRFVTADPVTIAREHAARTAPPAPRAEAAAAPAEQVVPPEPAPPGTTPSAAAGPTFSHDQPAQAAAIFSPWANGSPEG